MAILEVRLDSVASVRSTLDGAVDPVTAAILAELSGAESISVTITERESPIRKRDIYILQDVVGSRFNVRVHPFRKMVDLMLAISPALVTFLPPQETLGEKGTGELKEAIAAVKAAKELAAAIRVEPEVDEVKAASRLGADYVELSSRRYADAATYHDRLMEREHIIQIARAAFKFDLGVIVGGGLNYQNVREIAEIEQVESVAVGTAITARALMAGYENAVRDMVELVR